jgi:hypothetical protein
MPAEARVLTEHNVELIATWCGGRAVVQHDALDHSSTTPGVNVPVWGGVERAQVGDVIIQEYDGSFRIRKKERE